MNRAAKRQAQKATVKKYDKFTIIDVQKAFSIAFEMKKESHGHLYKKHMNELCVFCGATRKAKRECKYWVLTLMDRVQMILINPSFFKGADEEANWLQHGNEYQDVRVMSKETVDGD